MSSPSLNMGTASTTGAGAAWAHSLKTWAGPWLCFILPVCTGLFLATGPHAWDAALAWTLPVWLCIAADYVSPADRSLPKPGGKDWLLDARLYVLFALQLANIALMLNAVARLPWQTLADVADGAANLVAMRILLGTSSCCSGLAVAHELLHRRAKHRRWMGRILLWTVGYDHFALEHAHGHHRRACTYADPATARYGESFAQFFPRSVWGQWANAWRNEGFRLQHRQGLAGLMRHRVLRGMVMEVGLLMLIYSHYGWLPMLMFLYQAWAAVRMLEAVNYIQHWGLTRGNAGHHAWATDSWFTLHTFIGLSRHADHHAHAGKPCHRLLYRKEEPRLPHGYWVMVTLLRFRNRRFMELASRELKQKKLVGLDGGLA